MVKNVVPALMASWSKSARALKSVVPIFKTTTGPLLLDVVEAVVNVNAFGAPAAEAVLRSVNPVDNNEDDRTVSENESVNVRASLSSLNTCRTGLMESAITELA